MVETLGLIAGGIGIIAYAPYVRDILARRTRPERASWLIWSLEYSVLFAAQIAQGATHSLWLIGLQLLGVLVICGLSVVYGAGRFSRRDIALLMCAGVSLCAWYFTNNAALATVLLISVEIIAVLPTVIKTYRDPASETLSTWALIGVAGLLTLPVVAGGSPMLYMYPASLVLINFGVVAAILYGRRQQAPRMLATEEL